MIVIADTAPLISLMKIGKLTLLKELFENVQIPEAVFEELIGNPEFKNEAQEIKDCKYIQVVNVEDKKSVLLLRRATGLDAGESEAIVLTDEQKGNLLLLDEAKGRNVARQMGIRIMGTLGILAAAVENKYITYEEIVRSVDILKKSGRYIKKELYETLMETAQKHRYIQ